ncbi:VOC family protein [Bradyrhizobium prioriisuperbiae]|uniref:VOC family protein n=1 Tax=Bradyrhizobium prioriisuperbiae TaxID=2854389 RepID=UPI0028E6019C|nr:VOC family protein [Bradyrhizobium prioritasuperba]
MPLKHLIGLDHAVVAVRDLDAAGAAWKRLGFTISPRGTHSAHLGSGNYTIVFSDDYLELLGILNETPHNQATVKFLREHEGIERTAFTTDDAAAGVAEVKARGIAADGPVHFGRPVDLPNGGKSEAKFNIFRWPVDEAPGGLRIFACQHLTPEAVWIPELRSHANGAKRLVQVEVLSATPKDAAAQLSRLIDRPVAETADGYRVASGGTRADFLFYDAAVFAKRYPEVVRKGAVANGAVAIVIATDDLAKAHAIGGAVGHGDAVSVPAAAANGAILSFVAQ